MRKIKSGAITLDGIPLEADPALLRERGLAHVPEDRHHEGLVLPFEERENNVLGYHGDAKFLSGPFLQMSAMLEDAKEKIEKIRYTSAKSAVKNCQLFWRESAKNRAGPGNGA